MENDSTVIDPYFGAAVVAETAGFRARRLHARAEGTVPWHQKRASSTLFFCASGRIAVQIKKPPFRCILGPGQSYAVPAGVAMTMYAVSDAAGDCVVFEYGGSLDAYPAEPATLGVCFDRMEVHARPPEVPATTAYDDFTPGFSRMDVLFAAPAIRLIAQGHGPMQCVPWHSHDSISDAFFCMTGRLRIATREPDHVVVLDPGDSYTVPAGMAHFVSGESGQHCEMLILQGVGSYNYVAR